MKFPMQTRFSVLSNMTIGGCKSAFMCTDMREERSFKSVNRKLQAQQLPQYPPPSLNLSTSPRAPGHHAPSKGGKPLPPLTPGLILLRKRGIFPPSRHALSSTRESLICTPTSVAYFLIMWFGTRSTATRVGGSRESSSLSPSRSLREGAGAHAPSPAAFWPVLHQLCQ